MLISVQGTSPPQASAHNQYVDAPAIVSLDATGTLTVNLAALNTNYLPNYWAYEICTTVNCGSWSSGSSYTTGGLGQTTADVSGHSNWDSLEEIYVRTRAKTSHSANPWRYSSSYTYTPLTFDVTAINTSGVLTYNVGVNAASKITFWICTQASTTQSSSVCSSTVKTTSTAVGTGHTQDMSNVTLPGGGTFSNGALYWFYAKAEVSTGGFSVTDAIRYYPAQRRCTENLNPAVSLGTLGTAQETTLPGAPPYSGTIQGSPGLAACTDSNNRASQYFSFTLDEGGGVWFQAKSNANVSNHLTPEIRILTSIGGSATFANAINDDNESVLGVVLASGTYTAQVRSTQSIWSGTLGRGGAYNFTVKRIYPEVTALVFSHDSFQVTYDLGTYAPNMEALIEYKKTTDTSWTTLNAAATNSVVNGVKKRHITETKTGLAVNTQYDLRAKFKHAGTGQYTAASGVTMGYIAFPAPTRPSLDAPIYSGPEEPFSMLVTANWGYPQVEMTGGGTDSDWAWVVEWGTANSSSGSKSLRSSITLFSDDIGKTIKIRVHGAFECKDDSDGTDEPCQVYIAGYHNLSNVADRYEIPEGETWYSAWSDNNVFTVQADHLEVPTGIEPETDPLPGIVEAIDSILAAIGVAPESRRPGVWAFFLCFSLAIGGGFGGFAITGGTKRFFWAATFGGFVFFLVFVMAGPAWFGIPTVFAYATLVVPLMMVALTAVGSVRT